jgi:hypothetical protein
MSARARKSSSRFATTAFLRWGLFLVLALASLGIANGEAKAANISRLTTFECGAASVRVYFPLLYTSGGYETVYYSPDLWKYTSSGWQPYDTSKPWYSAAVGPNGIMPINGVNWLAYPSQVGTLNVPFWNLSPGWYAVKGYFYGGTSHFGNVWGTTSTMCQVT